MWQVRARTLSHVQVDSETHNNCNSALSVEWDSLWNRSHGLALITHIDYIWIRRIMKKGLMICCCSRSTARKTVWRISWVIKVLTDQFLFHIIWLHTSAYDVKSIISHVMSDSKQWHIKHMACQANGATVRHDANYSESWHYNNSVITNSAVFCYPN